MGVLKEYPVYIYQFMPAEYAIDNLRKRRLKVSLFEDLNDPFELLGARQSDTETAEQFKALKADLNAKSMILCFSRSWDSPLMWSHYADKHRGMCLGFKVADGFAVPVTYASSRLELQAEKQLAKVPGNTESLSLKLMTTKFSGWEYEKEVRKILAPSQTYKELGLYFYDFSDELRPYKVIIGPRCIVSVNEVKSALHPLDRNAIVICSRLAFKTFRVLPTRKI